MIECNLCGMQFNDRTIEILDIVKETHERWHKRCKIEGRNTVEGEVKWI
jgi:hypothetical protein